MSEGNVVYRHAKREEWGLAIVVEALQDRTTFLFEGVGTKTLGSAYLHMMEPADIPADEAAAAFERLASKVARPSSSTKAPPPIKKPDLTFEQQLAAFVAVFPEGFEDKAYVDQERGPEEGKGAHKQAAILRAATDLSKESLEAAEPAGVFEIVRGMMQASKKLISHADVAKIGGIPEGGYPALASALVGVLHGEGSYASRFDKYVSALAVKPKPNWPIATLLPALVHPNEHVFIKPTFFRTQGAILEMNSTSGTLPDGAAYARSLAVAAKVRDKLKEAGHTPRDLWDVSAFICRTASVKKSAPPPPPPAT